MNKNNLLLGMALLLSSATFAQISFSNQTAALLSDTTVYSGVAMGIADMNGDSLDDIIRLDNARNLQIEYQKADGTTFTEHVHGAMGSSSQWSLCIADVDTNGYNDILTGGAYNDLKLLQANDTGNSYTVTELTDPAIFLQGSNFVDIDNDGSIDIFACHDDGLSAPFGNDGEGNFVHDLALINTASTIPSDNSGNYGSIWTDYDNDGDLDLYITKCRFGVSDTLDGRRVNLLFQNDGSNNFTDVAEAAGLRPLAQSWAADFGDIDNDGDLDCVIINHDVASQIFENNGDGTFTDVTASTGIAADMAGSTGIQCIFDDFDNDGFIDLLFTSRGGDHLLFQNDGDFTFTTVTDPFPTSLRIQSAVTGDLDNDGYLDVFAGFANFYNTPVSSRPDKLYLNEETGNNYLKLLLKGETCNRNAIGARAEIFGEWGVQVREVRSGEGYGIMNSFMLHFGLGTEMVVDSLLITWPNGVVEKMCGISANQTFFLTEDNLPDLLTSNFTDTEIGLDVTFTDMSTGLPDTWAWDFGDGGSSTEQNPTHTFADNGPYMVSLTITNDCEMDVYSIAWGLAPLPLDLLSLSAEVVEKDQSLIRWSTANEVHFDRFELESSVDLSNFKTIATIQGKNDALQNDYQWIDRSPATGENYYRLKQIDLDGSYEYSHWVSVDISDTDAPITIHPNPTKDRISVQTGGQGLDTYTIYNATGQQVLAGQNQSGDFELDLSAWESGIYFIEMTSAGERQFIRFSKL